MVRGAVAEGDGKKTPFLVVIGLSSDRNPTSYDQTIGNDPPLQRIGFRSPTQSCSARVLRNCVL